MDRASKGTWASGRPCRQLFSIVLAVLVGGVQWDLLQGAAWIGMLVRYSAQNDLKTAAEMTFDGEHPCSLCKVVASARASTETDPDRISTSRAAPFVDLATVSTGVHIGQQTAHLEFPLCPGNVPAWASARPPVPPPRCAA